ncbi:diguanylate cyclase domain-containing protein [Pseudomonas sp. GCM10022188]|nr:diguanylate cyclase [Pseudomonas oryzagri]
MGALGALVAFSAYRYGMDMERKLRASEFERLTHVQSQHVQRLLEHSTQLLRAYRGFFLASGTVDRQQFERFSREVLGNYPEAFAIHWAPRVAEPDRARFERDIAAFQAKPLGIFDAHAPTGNQLRAPPRGVYYPIRYSEPLERNRGVIGLDTLERPYSQDVTRAAAQVGDQRITSVFPLIQDPDGPLAVAVYQPVYRMDAPLVTTVQRWEALDGYLILLLRPSLLLGEMSFGDARVDARLYEMQGETAVPIYPRDASLQPPSAGIVQHVLEVPGRKWVVEFVVEQPGGGPATSIQPLLLMLSLLSFTAMLLFYLARSQRSAVALRRANGELVVRQKELDGLAHYDALTGLPNRLLLRERMRLALAGRHRLGGQLAVCVIDLDGFKYVNDHFGHQAGDQVLRVVARRILALLRSSDTVARLGGDEFVVLLVGTDGKTGLEEVTGRLVQGIGQPIELNAGGQIVAVSASIGVALADGTSSVDSLIREADSAMYDAKAAGKGCYRIFGQGQGQAQKPVAERLPE